MDDQFPKDQNSAKVDYFAPESGQGPGKEAMAFNAGVQRKEFLGGGDKPPPQATKTNSVNQGEQSAAFTHEKFRESLKKQIKETIDKLRSSGDYRKTTVQVNLLGFARDNLVTEIEPENPDLDGTMTLTESIMKLPSQFNFTAANISPVGNLRELSRMLPRNPTPDSKTPDLSPEGPSKSPTDVLNKIEKVRSILEGGDRRLSDPPIKVLDTAKSLIGEIGTSGDRMPPAKIQSRLNMIAGLGSHYVTIYQIKGITF